MNEWRQDKPRLFVGIHAAPIFQPREQRISGRVPLSSGGLDPEVGDDYGGLVGSGTQTKGTPVTTTPVVWVLHQVVIE